MIEKFVSLKIYDEVGGSTSSKKNKKKKICEEKELDHLNVAQIAAQFNLVSTYETLEGAENLSREETIKLLQFAYPLTKD